MLICEAQSRIKWRRSCMTAIRKRPDKMETASELEEISSSAISEWLETATVAAGNKRKDKKQEALEKRSRHRKSRQDTTLCKEHYLYKTK